MKKLFILSMFIGCLVLFSQCRKALKNIEDYYPVVRTISVTEMQDGTVQVNGEIEHEGEAPIEFAGFCVSTDPSPEMTDNQLICQLSGTSFTGSYSGFDPYATYYFRSWATNDYGYSYGNIVYVDSIEAQPLEAPCKPALNTIDIGSAWTDDLTALAPEQVFDGWEITVNGYSYLNNIKFTFGEKPRTNIYTTTTSSSPGAGSVSVSFYAGFISGTLASGSNVYVNQLSPSSWEVTVCDAPWTYSSSTYYLTARFKSPY